MDIEITAQQVEQMSSEKSEIFGWGYKEYLKNENNEWYLDHLLIVDKVNRTSTFVYLDGRADIIKR